MKLLLVLSTLIFTMECYRSAKIETNRFRVSKDNDIIGTYDANNEDDEQNESADNEIEMKSYSDDINDSKEMAPNDYIPVYASTDSFQKSLHSSTQSNKERPRLSQPKLIFLKMTEENSRSMPELRSLKHETKDANHVESGRFLKHLFLLNGLRGGNGDSGGGGNGGGFGGNFLLYAPLNISNINNNTLQNAQSATTTTTPAPAIAAFFRGAANRRNQNLNNYNARPIIFPMQMPTPVVHQRLVAAPQRQYPSPTHAFALQVSELEILNSLLSRQGQNIMKTNKIRNPHRQRVNLYPFADLANNFMTMSIL